MEEVNIFLRSAGKNLNFKSNLTLLFSGIFMILSGIYLYRGLKDYYYNLEV